MKKKVLHVVESFGSGVFSFLVDLINRTDSDFEITVAYGVREETEKNFQAYFSNRVKFVEVKNFTRNISPQKDFKALKEIKNIIKKEKPDIVHLHSSKAGVLGRLAANGNRVKMFYNPHGFSFLKQDDSKTKRTICWLIEKAMATFNKRCTIVGCSKGEYEEARKLNKNSVHINNGIDVKKLEEEIAEFKEKEIDLKKLKVCTVGRIGYQKNPDMFNKVAECFPDVHFTWIGDGELRDKLTSSNIEITGWKTRNEVLRILNEQDVFILCSLWEGLPISLLEAMYLKKICIVSDCIGNRDVIKNGENGYIAKDLNENIKIINNIVFKTKNNEEILRNAKNDIKNRFNIEKMVKKYSNIYNERRI